MVSPKKFKTAVVGGTFDHFHKGQKKLLRSGLSLSSKLVVGITSDKYIKNIKFKISNLKLIQNYSYRKKAIEDFLEREGKGKYEIVAIDDMFGTTLSDVFIEAIVVSKETLKGARIINIKRKEKNLPPLEVIVQDSVLAQDGKPISSFRIRKGEVDREGKLYINPLWISQDLILPQELRVELRFPLGKLFKKIEDLDFKNNFLITVGDETSKIFNKLSIHPNIAVIDYKVARKKKYKDLKELGFLGDQRIYEVKNPPGSISKELFKLIKNIFENITNKDQIIIQIDGEEDLSVLPAVLGAPLGWLVYYGQPGRGIVKILVDEKNKAKIHEIVASFNTRGY